MQRPPCRNGRRPRASPCRSNREISRQGPQHAPEFTVAVTIDGYGDAEAKGSSKRVAEQAAAAAFMARENVAMAEVGA